MAGNRPIEFQETLRDASMAGGGLQAMPVGQLTSDTTDTDFICTKSSLSMLLHLYVYAQP